MIRRFIIIFLIFLFCSLIPVSAGASYPNSDVFRYFNALSCAKNFTYLDNLYNNCTTDGNNGDYPWCSCTPNYIGIGTYCVDFQNTTLECLSSFKMPDGKVYTKPAILSSTAIYPQCKTSHPVIKYRYFTDGLQNLSKEVLPRRNDCDPAYKNLAKDHTICYGPNKHAIPVPLTAAEKQDMLDLHNTYRAAVLARYMFSLYWDNELEKLAQAHSNLCFFDHDLAINRVSPKFNWTNGQNLAMVTEIRSPPYAIFDMMLSSEKPNFRYGDTCYPDEDSCLHYTQAILSNLTRVGCGQTHCVYPDRIERFITCNYLQSQYDDNYQTPYVPSKIAAIDCPHTNKSGLCDCGDKMCQYDKGEYLHPDKCICMKPSSSGKRSIDERDANQDELDSHTDSVIKLRPGNIGPRSVAKRHVKVIPIKHPNKRSIVEDDPNRDELDRHTESVIKLRPGTIASKSVEKRHLKTIHIKHPGKREISP